MKGEAEYAIQVSEAYLKKKKIYVDIPQTLVREKGTTAKEKSSWFGYMPKVWHPMQVVITKTGKQASLIRSPMLLTIKSDVEGMHACELLVKPDKAGVYWFQCIRPFIFGNITMSFTMDLQPSTGEGKEVAAFEPIIAVEFDAEGRTLDEIPIEEELALRKGRKRKNEAKDGDEDSDDEGEVDENGEPLKKKKKRPRQPSAYFSFCKVHREATKAENPDATFGEISKILGGMWKELDETEKEEYKAAAASGANEAMENVEGISVIDDEEAVLVEKEKLKKKKKKKRGQKSLEMDEVLPYPGSVPLNTKHHLGHAMVQDLLQQAGSVRAKDARKEVVMINGPQLVAYLPHSLVAALVRDRQRVSQLAARINKAPSKERERLTERLFLEEKFLHRPTVNELFVKLRNRASHIPEVEHALEHLRMCFEYTFESTLMFPEEKEVYNDLLEEIKQDEGKFGDKFGAYHFLRFLVFVVTGADFAETLGAEPADRSSASSQRTKAVSDRHYKALFSSAQAIIDIAMRDLEEVAISLFA